MSLAHRVVKIAFTLSATSNVTSQTYWPETSWLDAHKWFDHLLVHTKYEYVGTFYWHVKETVCVEQNRY
jgi:hypothetical protein